MPRSSPPLSNTARPRPPGEGESDGPSPIPKPHHRRKLSVRVASVSRWLHIYLSMFGLFVLLFFSATGITLNHPDWFYGGAETSAEAKGTLDPKWVKIPTSTAATTAAPADAGPDQAAGVAKLEVVEHLRAAHHVRGALASFTADDRECVVTFKGPGYAADAFIDRADGTYKITETSHGLVAVMNDLHKGRDTGPVWSVVIDASALLMIVASLSGLILLFYIKRRRVPGVVVGIVGTLVVLALVYFGIA